MRGHTPRFQNGIRYGPGFKECPSEIPCLVIELPASGATPMTNPAYNGEAQLKRRGNTVGSRAERNQSIDPVTTCALLASGAQIT